MLRTETGWLDGESWLVLWRHGTTISPLTGAPAVIALNEVTDTTVSRHLPPSTRTHTFSWFWWRSLLPLSPLSSWLVEKFDPILDAHWFP